MPKPNNDLPTTVGWIIAAIIFIGILLNAITWASAEAKAVNYCKSKGYDSLLKPNFLDHTRHINGTDYVQCYREQIINNTLVRDTAWLPYHKGK